MQKFVYIAEPIELPKSAGDCEIKTFSYKDDLSSCPLKTQFMKKPPDKQIFFIFELFFFEIFLKDLYVKSKLLLIEDAKKNISAEQYISTKEREEQLNIRAKSYAWRIEE